MELYNKRQSSIELMRIILMIMIITHHIIAYNFELYDKALVMKKSLCTILFCIDSMCIMAVNCFFLISGYFMVKFNSLKMIRLIVDAYFYYLLITLIGLKLNKLTMNKQTMINIIDPVDNYWFISVYLMLIILSSILNKYIERMEKKEFLKFLASAFLLLGGYGFILNKPQLGLNSGYSIIAACVLYLIGAGIKKWGKSIEWEKAFIFWLGITAINFGLIMLSVFFFQNFKITMRLLDYSNPLIVIQAVLFLKIFINLKMETNNYINKLSKHSLASYYVNSSNWLAMSFKDLILPIFSMETAVVMLIPFAGVSFIFAVIIDSIKCHLFDRAELKICKKLQSFGKIIFRRIQDLMSIIA